MKVFKSKFIGNYGGGGAIVAANSEEEALKVAFDESVDYHFRGYDFDSNINCPRYNNVTQFEEIQGLTYEGTEPKVLFCNIYEE